MTDHVDSHDTTNARGDQERSPDPRPAPPISPDADLRKYDWFKLYHRDLVNSDFWRANQRTPEVIIAALNLWIAAMHQVPAGSLPNDDEILADLAGLPGLLRRREKLLSANLQLSSQLTSLLSDWLPDEEQLLSRAKHGWEEHSDGRLYHPKVSKIVSETDYKRTKQAEGAAIAREKKKEKHTPTARQAAKHQLSKQLSRQVSNQLTGVDRERDKEEKEAAATYEVVAREAAPLVPTAEVAPSMPPAAPAEEPPENELLTQLRAACNGARMKLGSPGLRNTKPIETLLAKGVKLRTVLSAIHNVTSKPGELVANWSYFAEAIQELHAMGGGKPTPEPPYGHPLRGRPIVYEHGEPRCYAQRYDWEWWDAVEELIVSTAAGKPRWPEGFGACPGGRLNGDGCRCPSPIIKELCDKHGIKPSWYPPEEPKPFDPRSIPPEELARQRAALLAKLPPLKPKRANGNAEGLFN